MPNTYPAGNYYAIPPSDVPPITGRPSPLDPPLQAGGGGLGQIRYAEASGSPGIPIPAKQRTRLTFVVDPTQTQDFLNPPYVGSTFWTDQNVIPGYHYGDLVDVLINLLVVSQVINGQILADVDVGSPLGPTGSDTYSLFAAAGVAERVTLRLRVQVLNYFIQNGAALYLTSTVPLVITNEALLINVVSTYAGVTAS